MVTLNAKIKTAEHVSDDVLRRAMNTAFSDYAVPMELSGRAFALMMQQRRLSRAASRVAIIGGDVVAIWLMSVRGRRAYLISSGTCPEFRRQGLARQLGQDCLVGLINEHITNFQTEVLTSNKRAFDLYAALGTAITRQLECYELPSLPGSPRHDVRQSPWAEVKGEAHTLAEVLPSWQNSFGAIAAIANDVKCWTVSDARGLAGYAVVAPETRTLVQIGVRKDRRCEGVAQSLIKACHPGDKLHLLNVDAQSEEFRAFLQAIGAEPTVSQFELSMRITDAIER
ncbi:GNAT family N-acetyltransferase [Ruegeria atlantica]|uniref:GNAT family N-acetyltransferase n=1 Tax=Ruegeria atlantica TaxID=81569 RepID=UPI00147D11E6|nr:GNAT family N-acetyltransferase [Ruegeria atlantica]